MKRFVHEFVIAGALLTAAPLVASANPDHNPNERLDVLEAVVAKLTAQNTSEATLVAKLQADLASANDKIAALKSALAVVQANPVLAMGPYVSVRTDTLNLVKGPHIIFEGVNVHIRDGAGERWTGAFDGDYTGHPTGLGNLIVGYNELSVSASPTVRGGSHCLVVGPGHSYTSNWGFVAGDDNTLSALFATVCGGGHQVAGGPASTVGGGCGNQIRTTAWHTTISGGGFNSIASGPSGWAAVVSGGGWNTVSTDCGTVSGGWSNSVTDGFAATVSGGSQNKATSFAASVSGGDHNTASGPSASVSGGAGNAASGGDASVSGGVANTAAGFGTSVSGGTSHNVTSDSGWSAGTLPD